MPSRTDTVKTGRKRTAEKRSHSGCVCSKFALALSQPYKQRCLGAQSSSHQSERHSPVQHKMLADGMVCTRQVTAFSAPLEGIRSLVDLPGSLLGNGQRDNLWVAEGKM